MTERRWKHWSSNEIVRLRAALEAGQDVTEIAVTLGRTAEGIKQTSVYKAQIKFPRKKWSADETAYLHEALTAGTTIPEIARVLGRSSFSVQSAANKAGYKTRKLNYIPDLIGSYDILCVERPNRSRKALVRCRKCAREEWMRLAALKHRKGSGCRRCNSWSASPGQPRFCVGEHVGNFTITRICGPRLGGWQYEARDRRCGHEKTTVDKPDQPFKGILAACNCPARVTRDGYVCWSWYRDERLYFVPEHRIVMEQATGRELYPEETVHHINGVRDDNRLENLELWSSSHPSGQRVEDKIRWAAQLLMQYKADEMHAPLVKELLGGNQL